MSDASKNVANYPSRQARRADQRRRDKAEHSAQRAQKLGQLGHHRLAWQSYFRFFEKVRRAARQSDNLHTLYGAGGHPLTAWLERDGEVVDLEGSLP